MSLEIAKRKKVINWDQLYSTIDCITNTYKSSIKRICIECQMSHQIEKKNLGNWGQLCSTIEHITNHWNAKIWLQLAKSKPKSHSLNYRKIIFKVSGLFKLFFAIIKQSFFSHEKLFHPFHSKAIHPCISQLILQNHNKLVQVLHFQLTPSQIDQYFGNVKNVLCFNMGS